MVEIVKSNFDKNFDAIESAVRNADFIAFDTEFTGLYVNDTKLSLFNTIEERYKRWKEGATQFTISQLGIAAFKKNLENNSYSVQVYNVYLFPSSMEPVDVRFTVQASSYEFQKRFQFDFNKCIYDGLSFLNEDQEIKVRKHFADKLLLQHNERNQSIVQSIFSQVSEWYPTSEEGQLLHLSGQEGKEKMGRSSLRQVSEELMSRFPLLQTSIDDDGIITVERLSDEYREADREKQVMKELLGFSRIFKIMVECKKPLIGHNMMLDLLLIHEKFYRPLPDSYSQFKKSLHSLFPVIYDTKHISITLKKMDTFGEKTSFITELGNLFKYLKGPKGHSVIYTPDIILDKSCEYYESMHVPHEAGYDAYMCGYAFLRLCHISIFKDYKSANVVPSPFKRYLAETSDLRNKVNLAGGVHTMHLGGEDEKVDISILCVKSKKFSYRLNQQQLYNWFYQYGYVDVKLQNSRSALVAAKNVRCARNIQKAFKSHRDIIVMKYNPLKHSPLIPPLLLAGTLLSTGLCAWAWLSSRKPDF